MRNIKKYAECGAQRFAGTKRDLKASEIQEIYRLSKGDLYRALVLGFYLGVEAGSRAAARPAEH